MQVSAHAQSLRGMLSPGKYHGFALIYSLIMPHFKKKFKSRRCIFSLQSAIIPNIVIIHKKIIYAY